MPFVTKETTNVNLRLIYQQSFLRTELILGGGEGGMICSNTIL